VIKFHKLLIVTFIILAVACIFLAGCSEVASSDSPGGVQSSPSSSNTTSPALSTSVTQPHAPTAQEIALNSLTAIQKIKFLKLDMDFSMSFTLPFGDVPGVMTMHQIGTSSINLMDKQMYMDMNMEMEMPEQGKQNMSGEIYATSGWLYMKSRVPGKGDQWTKMALTDELWAQQSQLTSLTDFLNTPTALEMVGKEMIGGTECYILNITPDLNSLTNWMAGQMQSGSANVNPGTENNAQMFEKLTVKQWIDVNNYLPARQEIRIKYDPASITPGPTAAGDSQMAMDIVASLNYYDFGKTVTIQLPAEALNAQELSPNE